MAANESRYAQDIQDRRRIGASPADVRAPRQASERIEWDVKLVLDPSVDHTASADELAAIERLLGTDLDKLLRPDLS